MDTDIMDSINVSLSSSSASSVTVVATAAAPGAGATVTAATTTGAGQTSTTAQGLSFELESGFEPQLRARSNTWPLPRPEGYVDTSVIGSDINGGKDDSNGNVLLQQVALGQGVGALIPLKKNSSRRNAWGNLSYADLITQAITSASDKRLTLSQIYEWMVQNVPYFKDKGDSNSSAGWKVSILLYTSNNKLSLYIIHVSYNNNNDSNNEDHNNYYLQYFVNCTLTIIIDIHRLIINIIHSYCNSIDKFNFFFS